ncbi:hypothetical protein JHK85_034606 [Glycine max]|nr:hypothetical protein JHK85_034606 [Glycine max]
MGAPEVIQDRLIDIPPSYVETYKKYTRQGSRVVALTYKSLDDMTVSEAISLDRDIVENGLTFAGFVVMIIDDQALTAYHVASEVHIISKPTLILGLRRNGEGYNWVSLDETKNIHYRMVMWKPKLEDRISRNFHTKVSHGLSDKFWRCSKDLLEAKMAWRWRVEPSATKFGRSIHIDEVFQQTHIRKDTGEFVDERSMGTNMLKEYVNRKDPKLAKI